VEGKLRLLHTTSVQCKQCEREEEKRERDNGSKSEMFGLLVSQIEGYKNNCIYFF
jgi:hypothetical protein